MQEEAAMPREAVLLQHLHAALEHSMRGILLHRSLHCVALAAALFHACRGRGGAEGARRRCALTVPALL